MSKWMNLAKRARVTVLLVVLAILSHPAAAWACSVCYGEPNSPATRGLTWAIVVLGMAVVGVLAGVVSFFVHSNRKAGMLEATAAATALIEKS
jgi:hypothetical protein